ncbi:MAG TPA: TrbG/VirB9 family P-type conjugative transfer protein [Vicinamibacterales bacterium]|nr:TrbG/VirB9 family P-type conjugative transfer protein [Vicinamibacterales bacterium]HWI19200.1 TrbG/VirB9 family P-type conjugative transfer protein [Vicinamibacterales bacterium]
MRPRWFFAVILTLVSLVSPVAAQTTGIREVTASDRSVIPLNTKLRFTTMVVLPQDEEILDVICGDRDFWVISATQNIAHVKPAKDGATTNLNLVTASGAIYSFLLTEGKTPQPDLKVYVTADSNIARGKPKYYSANQVAALEGELTEAKAAIQLAHARSEETIASFRKEYPATLAFAYGTPKYEKPFFVRSIWHDGQFTYIRSDARELPTLYELRDGQPSLVNFQVQNGTYVIPKVLDRGYLALGKERFAFNQGQ